MAKGFGMGAGRAMPDANAAATAAAKTDPVASVSPTTNGNRFGMDDRTRDAIAQQLIAAGVGQAGTSGSPLLAALAPIAGAFMGGKISTREKDRAREESSRMTSLILGDRAKDPALAGYVSVINDPNATDEQKALAKIQFQQAIKPVKPTGPGSRGGRGGGGGGGGSGGQNLYGEYNMNGNLAGRNKSGQIVLYRDQDGNPVPFTSTRGLGVERTVDGLLDVMQPDQPTVMSEGPAPMAMPEDDPLGLRRPPA